MLKEEEGRGKKRGKLDRRSKKAKPSKIASLVRTEKEGKKEKKEGRWENVTVRSVR